MDSSIHLNNTKTKTGADTEHGADDREDVDQVSNASENQVAQDWVKQGSHGHRETLTVAKESEEKAENDVNNPTMDSPMEESEIHGVLSSLIIGVPGKDDKISFVAFSQTLYSQGKL